MNRTAIITGATRGIGHGVFCRLAEQGYSIATLYHRNETAVVRAYDRYPELL